MPCFLSSFFQDILNATVEHKSTLSQLVESSAELQLVELPGWAGLGGVRYLPAQWRSNNVDQLPDQGKEEINKINRQLVATLKMTDSAFSLGSPCIYYSCRIPYVHFNLSSSDRAGWSSVDRKCVEINVLQTSAHF